MPNSEPMKAPNKAPQITAVFWVIKILTTGMGEALADFFDHAFEPILVVVISAVVLAFSLWLQLGTKGFVAWRYWFAVSMVSVFGTLAADAVHVMLGVPYWASSIVFFVSIIVLFIWWQSSQKSISIGELNTLPRELFYWAVVMATFALGTAAGDLTAVSLGWGFLNSGLLFTAAFAVPLVSHDWAKRSEPEGASAVILFWVAYVVTRPMGASFADYLALPAARGGLGLGTLEVSLVMIAAISVFVGFNRSKAKA